MIAAYVGLPGHGKSYGVVENVIIPSLKSKRPVFTNIPLNDELCLKTFGVSATQFKTQDLIENPNWFTEVFEPGAVLVLDECWRLWPSGLKANAARPGDKAFIAEHRHMVGENGMSTEIILVTQDLSQLASWVRNLIETTFRMYKLSKLGADKSFRVDVYSGPITGANPPTSKREREMYGKFTQNVYQYYQSHTKSKTGDAGNEKVTDQRFKVLSGMSVKIGIVAVVLLGVFAFYGFKKVIAMYKPDSHKADEISAATVSVPVNNTAPKVVMRFLSEAKMVLITWNNGHYPSVEYLFSVVFETGQTEMSAFDFKKLGYKVLPVNQCLVRIIGPDADTFAVCPSDAKENGFFQKLASVSE